MPNPADIAATPLCFTVPGRLRDASAAPLDVRLADAPSEALAVLLPLLGCGEEAAALAFSGLAERHRDTPETAAALDRIAREERVHDQLIGQMLDALPAREPDKVALAAARRFHIGLMRGGPAFHLARIAALDSAVCIVLSRVLRPDGALARDPVIGRILSRIHRDESAHVRLSRTLARAAGATLAMRDAAAGAREALARVLMVGAEAFERLGVDPDRLESDLKRLPNGLLAA